MALLGQIGGQSFSFHGYLPAKDEPRRRKIQELERESRKEQRTQLFIETPYRNRQMLQTLVSACAASTRICVATDLSLASESIQTGRPAEWRRRGWPDIDRRPSVFLLQA